MEALMGLMIMYSVGITIAFFCVLKSRSRYVNKSEFLTRKIKEIMEQNAAYRPAPKPTVQQPVQASPAEVQTVSQAQPAAPAQAAVQPQPQVQV